MPSVPRYRAHASHGLALAAAERRNQGGSMSRSVRAAVCVLLLSAGAWAQTPSVVLNAVVTGLNQPVYFTNAHDGSNRTFLIEQPGRILVMQPGSNTTAVFLD